MSWAHLPVAGGLLDQDPDLLDKFRYIFGARNKKAAEEAAKHDRERDKADKANKARSRASRPRVR